MAQADGISPKSPTQFARGFILERGVNFRVIKDVHLPDLELIACLFRDLLIMI